MKSKKSIFAKLSIIAVLSLSLLPSVTVFAEDTTTTTPTTTTETTTTSPYFYKYTPWETVSEHVIDEYKNDSIVSYGDYNGDTLKDYRHREITFITNHEHQERFAYKIDSATGKTIGYTKEFRAIEVREEPVERYYIDYGRWEHRFYTERVIVDRYTDRYILERYDVNKDGAIDSHYKEENIQTDRITEKHDWYKVENKIKTFYKTETVNVTYKTFTTTSRDYWVYGTPTGIVAY